MSRAVPERGAERAGVVYMPHEGAPASSTKVSRAIFAAAMDAARPELGAQLREEPDWRARYPEHAQELTRAGLEDPDAAIAIARAGLDAAHAQFGFSRDGETLPLREAMARYTAPVFHTGIVRGEGTPERSLGVPYRGQVLKGGRLRVQLDLWRDADVLEPSACENIERVLEHPRWQDLSDLHFVLLGASAEVGPLEFLLRHGANVWAVDLPDETIWARLLKIARESAGTLRFPMRAPQTEDMDDAALAALAGADLLTDTPELRTWLLEADAPLTIGSYAYLNGKKFVLVSIASDALIADVMAQRPGTTFAALLTPTDVYGVPAHTADRAEARLAQRRSVRLFSGAMRRATRGHYYTPNIQARVERDGISWGIVDSTLLQQGANYTLAKRIQRWRALVARAEGQRVSCRVAPATATASVTQKRLFRAGYDGSEYFGVEIFAPSTTNALMAAQLIRDLRDPGSTANPETPLATPLAIFMDGAIHGGFWRMTFQLRSVLHPAVVLGFAPAPRKR